MQTFQTRLASIALVAACATAIGVKVLPLDSCDTSPLSLLGMLTLCAPVSILLFIAAVTVFTLRGYGDTKRAVALYGITLLTILGLRYGPTSQVMREWAFKLRQTEYEQVVELVRQGSIQPLDRNGYYALLPDKYRYLSNCGQGIQMYARSSLARVFFYASQEAFYVSGYLYASDGRPEIPHFHDLECQAMVRPNWYFCEHGD